MSHAVDTPDADILLITAYLAGEMTADEILAVDDRLLSDAAFRDKVQPLIDIWQHPGSFARARTASVARGPAAQARTAIGRRSMRRAAAVIVMIGASALAVAQGIRYVTQHAAPTAGSGGVASSAPPPRSIDPVVNDSRSLDLGRGSVIRAEVQPGLPP